MTNNNQKIVLKTYGAHTEKNNPDSDWGLHTEIWKNNQLAAKHIKTGATANWDPNIQYENIKKEGYIINYRHVDHDTLGSLYSKIGGVLFEKESPTISHLTVPKPLITELEYFNFGVALTLTPTFLHPFIPSRSYNTHTRQWETTTTP